jgi:PIN domain nuclease of toxin-antitoxin system
VKILLDTHIALWAFTAPGKLPNEVVTELCSAEHVYMIKTLVRSEGAPRHNDPFDRLMISQAKAEGMIFVTHDSLIPYYNEKCVMYV